MKFFKLKNIEDGRELYYKVKKNACDDLDLNRRMLDRTKVSVKEIGGDYRPHHKGWCLTVLDSEEDKIDVSGIFFEDYSREITTKDSKEEVKPKYTLSNGMYEIKGKELTVRLSEDDLRKLRKLYCLEKININQVCIEMNILRDQFFLIKNCFSLVKTDVPYSDEDVSKATVDELAEDSIREKKLAYYKKVDKLEIRDMKRDLDKFAKRDYLYDKAINKFKNMDIVKFDIGNKNNVVGEVIEKEAIAMLSDLHIGKMHDSRVNRFNKKIARDRMEFYVKNVIDMLDPRTKLTVMCLGDNIDGITKTNARINSDMDVNESTKYYTELLLGAIDSFTSYFDEVEMYSIAGNHPRYIENLKESIETENFEDLSNWYIRLATKSIPNFRFKENDIYGVIEHTTFNGKRVIGIHGHETGTSKLKNAEDLVGYKADYIKRGHFHNRGEDNVGNLRVTTSPSFVGVDDYAKGKFLISKPAQLLEVYHKNGTLTTHEIDLSNDVIYGN